MLYSIQCTMWKRKEKEVLLLIQVGMVQVSTLNIIYAQNTLGVVHPKSNWKKVNKKRTVTVRRVIIFLNISRHPLLICLHCCLCMFYSSLMSTLKTTENLNFAPPCFLVFSYSKQVYMLEHTIVILTRNVRYLFLVKILSANICVLFLRWLNVVWVYNELTIRTGFPLFTFLNPTLWLQNNNTCSVGYSDFDVF